MLNQNAAASRYHPNKANPPSKVHADVAEDSPVRHRVMVDDFCEPIRTYLWKPMPGPPKAKVSGSRQVGRTADLEQ